MTLLDWGLVFCVYVNIISSCSLTRSLIKGEQCRSRLKQSIESQKFIVPKHIKSLVYNRSTLYVGLFSLTLSLLLLGVFYYQNYPQRIRQFLYDQLF